MQCLVVYVSGRPAFYCDPTSVGDWVYGFRLHAVFHPYGDLWAIQGIVVDALQPLIPPFGCFAQVIHCRLRHSVVLEYVCPRSDDGFSRNGQAFHQCADAVGVGIGISVQCEYRNLNVIVVHADGTVLPVVVSGLMFQPVFRPQRHLFQSLDGFFIPCIRLDFAVYRTAHICQHDVAPPEVVVQEAAALVVDVLCITIVYEADADDGLQRPRSSCGNLEGVESGPGLALHTDISVAPWLCSNPVDGIDGIVLFLLQILIVETAVGFAGTAHVHADNVVSHSSEVSVHRFVSASHTVSLTIWLGFEDGWQRFIGLWFPHTCRTSASVGHRYPDIFNDLPLIRELFPGHYPFLFKFLFSHYSYLLNKYSRLNLSI